MIPEQTGPLAARGRNVDLVVELMTRVDMDEHVVAVPLRRHTHAVIVQVGRIIGEIVSEGDPHRVAKPRSEQRRQVNAVVEKSGERIFTQLHPSGRGGDRCIEDAIVAANFRRLNKRLPPFRICPAGLKQRGPRPKEQRSRSPHRCSGEPCAPNSLQEGSPVTAPGCEIPVLRRWVGRRHVEYSDGGISMALSY